MTTSTLEKLNSSSGLKTDQKKISKISRVYRSYSSLLCGSVACALVLLLGSYVYFVNQTVWNVAKRQAAQTKINDLSSDISNLESNYMTLKHAISLDQAKSLGFNAVSASDAFFVGRSTVGKIDSVALTN